MVIFKRGKKAPQRAFLNIFLLAVFVVIVIIGVTRPAGKFLEQMPPPVAQPMWFCGDGSFNAVELCEDCNTNNFDGCSGVCQIEYCGDGIIQPGEQCEYGKNTCGSGNYCLLDGNLNSSSLPCICQPKTIGKNPPVVMFSAKPPAVRSKGKVRFQGIIVDTDKDLVGYQICRRAYNQPSCGGWIPMWWSCGNVIAPSGSGPVYRFSFTRTFNVQGTGQTEFVKVKAFDSSKYQSFTVAVPVYP